MCGITGGVWTEPERAISRDTLQRMTDVLRHRGPDDEGGYCSDWQLDAGGASRPGVALGHRRLAIIDIAGGRQPLGNEDDSVQVVFNGEIYNFRQLRQRLEAAGHQFRTHCDTEVLVHLYEDEGPGFLQHLVGMFALAIWDSRQRLLLLARDRLGQKPLVYREEPGRLLFASELKSLLEVPGVPREIDPQALDEYLTYQYVPHARTIFRGIAKLPPGHFAVYRDGRLDVQPYWRPDFNVEEPRPAEEYVRQLRAAMTAAVESQLQSDVPLGAFLSGGIDSSIVVGLMRQLAAGPVRTFCIGFPVPEYDETHYARIAAEHFGTIHEEFRIDPRAVDVLPKLVWHYDEPFADSSAVPTWYLSQLTRQHVTVALSGDGGDELFAGYPRYQAVWLAHWLDRLPGPARRLFAGKFWQRLPGSARQKSVVRHWKRFVEALDLPPAERYLEWISIFGAARRRGLYTTEFARTLVGDCPSFRGHHAQHGRENGTVPFPSPLGFLTAAWARSGRRDPVTAVSLADLLTYLPGDLMTKVDIASMARGLECRQPFLDHRVVELAARMPVGLKFRRGRGKRILLRAFADMLPKAILQRGKMGFGVPLDHWFRAELREFAYEILLERRTTERGLFRPDAIRKLWDEHQQRQSDHSNRLWTLLVLELWQREWLDWGASGA